MANCKQCRHFNLNNFSCTNRNVSAQHKLNDGDCSYFAGLNCGSCAYCHYGSGFFVRNNLYCSCYNNKQVYANNSACGSYKAR